VSDCTYWLVPGLMMSALPVWCGGGACYSVMSGVDVTVTRRQTASERSISHSLTHSLQLAHCAASAVTDSSLLASVQSDRLDELHTSWMIVERPSSSARRRAGTSVGRSWNRADSSHVRRASVMIATRRYVVHATRLALT